MVQVPEALQISHSMTHTCARLDIHVSKNKTVTTAEVPIFFAHITA